MTHKTLLLLILIVITNATNATRSKNNHLTTVGRKVKSSYQEEQQTFPLEIVCEHCNYINTIHVANNPQWAQTEFDCAACSNNNRSLTTKYYPKYAEYRYSDPRIVNNTK